MTRGVALESPVPGTPRVIVGTMPAIGVNWTETVPVGVRWNLKSITVELTTDATAGTRFVIFQMLGPLGNIWFARGPTQSQLPSTVRLWNYSNTGREQVSGTFVVAHNPMPDDCWMVAGSVFRVVNFLAIHAGDQWGAPVFYVHEVTG